ncbi:MAG: SDR family NAD(P)-dependent oxidoreductase, partial [Verrucomicrobia bacterium]|nr:SDR family NAD(P)-dependent oxidoreductase [Verrucomicrobiota bacterium]
MNANLTGKIAIVTGAAQGLGQAISRRLAHEGCSVVMADLNEQGLTETASALSKESGSPVLGVKT